MIVEIPLKQYPSQSLSSNVNGDNLSIAIYLALDNLYMDIYNKAVPVILGARCVTGVSQNQYNGLNGYLTWVTQDNTNPTWQQLGLTAHLLYSDVPLTDSMYAKYVKANLSALENEFS